MTLVIDAVVGAAPELVVDVVIGEAVVDVVIEGIQGPPGEDGGGTWAASRGRSPIRPICRPRWTGRRTSVRAARSIR